MIKKFLIASLLFILSHAEAATLNKIRSNAEPKNHRIVFDVDGLKGFKTDKKNDQVTITIFECELTAANTAINSRFIQNFKVEQSGGSTKISFKLPQEYKVKTFKIDQPDRIVLDVSSSGYIQPPAMADPNEAPKNKPAQVAKNDKKTKPTQPSTVLVDKKKSPEKTEPAPKPIEATLPALQQAWSAGELDKVITLSSTIIKSRPDILAPYYFRSQAYLEKGRREKVKNLQNKFYKSAVQDLNKVVIDSLNYIEGHAKIAEIYRLLGEEAKAEEHYALFMGGFQQENNNDSTAKPSAKEILPVDNQQTAADSSGQSPILGENLVSKLLLIIGLPLILILIITLIWIRKRINDKISEEVEDTPSAEPEKDDLFEKLRPKNSSSEDKSETQVERLNRKSFVKNESTVLDYKQPADKMDIANTEQDVLSKMLDENSQDEDFVSIRLDESIRDRIIELYDDGYTNKEIAEQLKISYDEVNFIIRSLGEADNETKNKNSDVLNSSAGGITDSQNEETMQMKEIQELYQQGVSIDELANYFKKPKDEVEFIVSLIPKEAAHQEAPVKSAQASSSQSFDSSQEEDKLTYKIKELAEAGLSRKEIAEELQIGLDEVDFAAAMFKIDFAEPAVINPEPPPSTMNKLSRESVVEWTKGSDSNIAQTDLKYQPQKPSEPFANDEVAELPEEIDEAQLISQALEQERKQEAAEQFKQSQAEIDVVDDIINEEPEEEFSLPTEESATDSTDQTSQLEHFPEEETALMAEIDPIEESIQQPSVSETKVKSLEPKILAKDEIGIDLDKFLASRSINQDFGVAESRIFDFNKDEFKDIFNNLPSADDNNTNDELLSLQTDLKNLEQTKSKPIENIADDDYFLKKSALRQQLAAEMQMERKTNNQEIEKRFEEIDAFIDEKLQYNNPPRTANTYTPPELSQSFEAIISDYDTSDLTETSVLPDKDDDDLLLMRRVYQLLDEGMEPEGIARELEISIDDVIIYKKIKDGDS